MKTRTVAPMIPKITQELGKRAVQMGQQRQYRNAHQHTKIVSLDQNDARIRVDHGAAGAHGNANGKRISGHQQFDHRFQTNSEFQLGILSAKVELFHPQTVNFEGRKIGKMGLAISLGENGHERPMFSAQSEGSAVEKTHWRKR